MLAGVSVRGNQNANSLPSWRYLNKPSWYSPCHGEEQALNSFVGCLHCNQEHLWRTRLNLLCSAHLWLRMWNVEVVPP